MAIKRYMLQIFKSHHRTKVFEKIYPDPKVALSCINCWTNSKFRTMQEVYEFQKTHILRTNDGNDMVLTMLKNNEIIETNNLD